MTEPTEQIPPQNAAPKKRVFGRPWKKGQSGNPRGRGAKILPITKLQREYTAKTIAEVYSSLIEKTKFELNSIVIDPLAPILDKIIAKSLLRDLRNSTPSNMERLLERIIGPIPVKNEHTGGGGVPLAPPQIILQEHVSKEPPPAVP